MSVPDVVIIGGGIIGTSAAAFLAEAGASVTLFERAELAAGASGRNSGAVQRPLDLPLGVLYRATVEHYRQLADMDLGFPFEDEPTGLLIVSRDQAAVATVALEIAQTTPDLWPQVLGIGEVQRLEPQLAPDLGACRLETGYPVAPASATLAFAQRARAAGALIEIGVEAQPIVEGGRVTGVRIGNQRRSAGQILLAAGPWTSELVTRWIDAPPIRSLWGVVAGVELADPPRHVIEELGIDSGSEGAERLFSIVSAAGATSVGSIFAERQPEPGKEAPAILERATRFVPALSSARVTSVRACARPLSFDGRPLIGPVPGVEGLFVCAGHGPWGISTGPASAMLVADQMLSSETVVREFDPARFQQT
ncbi:MAG TPA: FAD-dependent oxidoreductase [Candidatus Limnocylindrales bacterium]|nr:FAD-dependent oxidoreductase [Candidatus Limnocylindrales bacterium]